MLIPCPACGKRISDRAPACPFCKAPAAGPAVSALQPDAPSVSVLGAPPPPKPPPEPSVVPPPPPPAPSSTVTEVTASPRFARGDFIADGLQVMEILGEGGFGVVYLAANHETGQLLALKALRNELLRDARVVEMFRKEARIWIELGRHPHVVKAEWVDRIGGRLYVAMEYVRGRPGQPNSLEGVLRKAPPPPEQALLWAIEFCHGMEHALSRGIRCHRDIKPANILIAEDGKVRISDFGIAGLAQQPEAKASANVTPAAPSAGDPSHTLAGTVFGTPTHMSPEQFEDAAGCDERSDIYSFGVVLHQLATARLPFAPPPVPAGADAGMHYWLAFRSLHALAEPAPLTSPVGAIVARCLRKARIERPASFRELRGELEAAYATLAGLPAPALSSSEESVADLVNRGLSLSSLGRPGEALACYERALALAPNEKAIHNNKGNVLRKMGKPSEALACFERALQLDGTYDDAWYNKGLLFTQAGRLGEALQSFDQALTFNVRNIGAWIGKSHVLGRLGRPAEELQCLDRALEVNPRDPIAWFNKGTLLSGADAAQALRCFERALEADPRYAQAWGAKALVLAEAGRPAEALTCFDEALRIDANDPLLHYNKGNVLAAGARYLEAHSCYDAATRLPGHLPIAWYNRALAEHHLRRFDAALGSLREFCDRAAPADPFRAAATRLIGKLERGDRSPLGASVSNERIAPEHETVAIPEAPPAAAPGAVPPPVPAPSKPAPRAASPMPQAPPPRPRPAGSVDAWNERAAGFFREKRYAEAAEATENALRLDKTDATALNNLANCLYHLGKREEAVGRLERVLLLKPDFVSAWFNKGVMESLIGRKPEALRSMLEVGELTRGDDASFRPKAQEARADLERQGVRPAPRTHLGWLAAGFQGMVAGQPDKAMTCFEQALAARPDLPELWGWKGSALRETNRLDDSLACYDQALASVAPTAELRHGRAMTLVKLRRFDDAVAEFDRALALDPEHAASWSDRGKTLGVLKRNEEALASFGHAAQLAPDNPAPWQNQALIAEELRRPDDALRFFHEFLKHAKPDMRLQIEHAKARVQVLEARRAALPKAAAPKTPAQLDAVLQALLPLAALAAPELAELEKLQRAGRREEALLRLVGADAAGRYMASAAEAVDVEQLKKAIPSAVDAMRKDPALRGLIPFADVSSADMAKVAELMKAGREDEAFKLLAASEAQADQARGGRDPAEEAASDAAFDALMALVDKRVAEQMAAAQVPAGPAVRPGNPVARKYADRAAEEIKAGQFAKALASLDQAIARDPTVALFFSNRGLALSHLGRTADATEAYEKALSLDPRCVPALVNRSGQLNAAGRFQEALVLASKAVEAASDTAAVWANLGTILINVENWKQAAQALLIAVQRDPKDARVWVGLGQATQRLGKHDAALDALNQGLALDPRSSDGWYQKGNALVSLGRPADAAEAYGKCVELDPRRANAWYNLGFALNEIGRHADAIAPCEKAIALHPGFDRAWLSKGYALSQLGRTDEAIAAYDKALEITPGYLIALANKGDALRRVARKPEALACFEAVLAQRPKDSRALGARAELLDELGRTEEAVPAYETWLEIAKLSPAEGRRVRERLKALKPKPATAAAAEQAPIPEAVVPKVLWTQPPPDCQKKGEIALAQGQPAKALEWFDQSIAGDPRNYNAWGGKADALFALKRHLECVAHAAKALEINPRFVAGWQRKALALEAAGRPEQALEAWDKGVEMSARNIQLWNGRGQTLIALGRDAEAVASFDQALAVDSRFSVARYNKALAEERLGRLSDAVRSYQQFIALAPPHLASQVQEARRKIQELAPS